jgi:hypothetical protein
MEIDHDKPDDDNGDAEYQAWKKITKKGRAKVAVSLRNQVTFVTPAH